MKNKFEIEKIGKERENMIVVKWEDDFQLDPKKTN